MTARPRKVECIVLGRGLAAATLAWALVQRGRRVALLVEEPGWEQGSRPAWPGWHHTAERRALAEAGAAQVAAWQAAGLPGLAAKPADGAPLWLLALGPLLAALGTQVAAAEGCWLADNTRVRGLSVIEGAILGAIAEDARYDARRLVNAAEDERYSAFARMLRQPHPQVLYPFAPPASELAVGPDGAASWPDAAPFVRAAPQPAAEPSAVRGAWRVHGVAGWPLLAIGTALTLAESLEAQGYR